MMHFRDRSFHDHSCGDTSIGHPARCGRVLVVDDNKIILEATRLFLEGAGFKVSIQESAFEMSAAILESRPDVILLDVHMPALTGDQAAEILRRYPFTRDIPVLLFSDLEENELSSLVRSTGVAGFVKKSAGQQRMIEEVKHWAQLSRHQRYQGTLMT